MVFLLLSLILIVLYMSALISFCCITESFYEIHQFEFFGNRCTFEGSCPCVQHNECRSSSDINIKSRLSESPKRRNLRSCRAHSRLPVNKSNLHQLFYPKISVKSLLPHSFIDNLKKRTLLFCTIACSTVRISCILTTITEFMVNTLSL